MLSYIVIAAVLMIALALSLPTASDPPFSEKKRKPGRAMRAGFPGTDEDYDRYMLSADDEFFGR